MDIPRVEYNEDEKGVWKFIYGNMIPKYKEIACKEYNDALDAFKVHVGFCVDEIP